MATHGCAPLQPGQAVGPVAVKDVAALHAIGLVSKAITPNSSYYLDHCQRSRRSTTPNYFFAFNMFVLDIFLDPEIQPNILFVQLNAQIFSFPT